MKVRAIVNFNDLEEKVKRVAGKSEWECSEERAKFLIEHNAVEVIKEEKELLKDLAGFDAVNELREEKPEIEVVEAPDEAVEVKKPRKAKITKKKKVVE